MIKVAVNELTSNERRTSEICLSEITLNEDAVPELRRLDGCLKKTHVRERTVTVPGVLYLMAVELHASKKQALAVKRRLQYGFCSAVTEGFHGVMSIMYWVQ